MSSPHSARPDLSSSEVVQTGIALADQYGASSAAIYLSGRGIMENVIARVVNQPEQRRNTGRLRERDSHLAEESSRYKFLL